MRSELQDGRRSSDHSASSALAPDVGAVSPPRKFGEGGICTTWSGDLGAWREREGLVPSFSHPVNPIQRFRTRGSRRLLLDRRRHGATEMGESDITLKRNR